MIAVHAIVESSQAKRLEELTHKGWMNDDELRQASEQHDGRTKQQGN
jgi:hypothetical protein